MSSLSFLFDRLIRVTLFYFLLVALLVIGIPSVVVLYHLHGTVRSPEENVLPNTIQLSLDNTVVLNEKDEKEPKSLPMLHLGKAPVTFGWVSGTTVQAENYQKLQIVSPYLAELDSSTPVKPVLTRQKIVSWHEKGLKVWGRVDLDNQTASGAHDYLTSPEIMNEDIAQLKAYVSGNHLDGLNIDIENVRAADRSSFLSFVALLSREVKSAQPNTAITVDIQAESGFSHDSAVSYNRALARASDYVIFMGYDEHWGSDPNPGPVASLQWLKDNVRRMIQADLPSDKLLLGLPSYTRIWKVGSQGQNLSSRAVSNEYINNVLNEEQISQRWQSRAGAYFSTFSYRGAPYEVWSEDTAGVQSLLKLVSESHLAGFGFWSLDMMSSGQWNTLAKSWRP
ncbi:MAG: glycosyl hydrolase family 18 protein [Sporolactobacillus sp.]